MAKVKNHNSLVFFTTLGVYLSLVLVGGPAPQVFAHGALTRNFEITEEAEVKDDLDKDPQESSDAVVDPVDDRRFLAAVQTFLAQFKVAKAVSLYESAAHDIYSDERHIAAATVGSVHDTAPPAGAEHLRTVTHLPRASIDPLLADA